MKNVNYNKIVIESQDLIRNIDGITGSDAFEEIIKIIFTMNLFSTQKLDSTSLKFFYTDKVFPKYDFFIGDYIKLKDITIEQILYLFSDVDFESEDIRGRLFETYLGRVFTSGLGQFFTPREIVEFITGFLHKKNLIPKNALILDPACGSSGILLSARNSETGKIVGYDINERLVRVSKMNMVLHGIENYEINNQSFLKCPNEEIYDVCITNPPFGVEEKQKNILKEFILGHDKKSCDLEILFIEKILKVLKPGGICGIVLPDGVFNNMTSIKLREYILQHSNIIASVDLPENVFKSSGTGCETGILFFRKKENNIESQINFEAYKINFVGYETQTKFAKKIPKNDLKDILNDVEGIQKTIVTELNSTKRFDGKYYFRKEKNKNKLIMDIFENSGKKIVDVYKNDSEIIRYIQYTDIDPVFGIIKSYTEMEVSEAPSRAKIVINTGDILIPKLKQSSDKIAIVTEEFDGCVATNGFKVIRPKNGKNSELVFALFRDKKIQEQLQDYSSGTIMPSIDDDHFNEIVFIDGDVNEDELTKKVKEIFELIDIAKNKMIELNSSMKMGT
jgi:type I restriction-modification system DNA methylase subunit